MFELSSLNVDCHDPAAVPFFHLPPHSRLVDLLTTLCELFLAVTWPSYCYAWTPFSSVESDPGRCNPSMQWPEELACRSYPLGSRLICLRNG